MQLKISETRIETIEAISGDSYLEDLLTKGAKTSIDETVLEVPIPEWYDEHKFRRAQRCFRQNFAAIYYGVVCGLLAAMAVPSILGALIFTTQKPSFKIAARRYMAAMKHTINWYREDLHPGSSSWKSLLHVRRVHSLIIKRANARQYGIIISQKDMALTQFAFFGYVILAPEMIGAQLSPQDMDALCHFWRVFGFLLGMDDRYNICTDEMTETVDRIVQIQRNALKPALANPSSTFEQAVELLFGGLWCFNLLLDYKALMFAAGRIAGLPGHHYWARENCVERDTESHHKQLNWKSRAVLFVILSIHEVLLKHDWIRQSFNWVLLASGRSVQMICCWFKLFQD